MTRHQHNLYTKNPVSVDLLQHSADPVNDATCSRQRRDIKRTFREDAGLRGLELGDSFVYAYEQKIKNKRWAMIGLRVFEVSLARTYLVKLQYNVSCICISITGQSVLHIY